MTSPFTEEIEANLSRSRQALNASRSLHQDGYFDFAASRSYYSAFYAATALLLNEGLEFKKHSGIIAAIHQKFVKPGKIDQMYGKNLNWLFELRSIGDYGVTTHVPESESEKAITYADKFLELVETRIKHDL